MDGEYQKYVSSRRRLHPRALLRQVPRAAERWSSTFPTSSCEAPAGRARPGKGLRRLQGRRRPQGLADRDPGARPSRATGWARPAKAATSPTSRKSSTRRNCGNSAAASASRFPTQTIEEAPFYKPSEDSPEVISTCKERRAAAGRLSAASRSYGAAAGDAAGRVCSTNSSKARATAKMATTMAFVRLLAKLLRDKNIGKYIVPIVPDEARTFGMESLFRQFGHLLARRTALRAGRPESLLYYKEAKDGADPRGGHHRGRLDVLVHCRRHGLRHPRHPHDPVFHSSTRCSGSSASAI